MNRIEFLEQISEIKHLIENVGGIIVSETVSEPANRDEVEQLEKAYHVCFPEDFVYYLTNVAAEVDIHWSFNRDVTQTTIKAIPSFLNRFNAIYSGSLMWSLKTLTSNIEYFTRFNPNGVVLRESCTVTEENELIGTLAICEVPCGDEIRMNLAAPTEGKPIFYLGHDNPDGSLIQLAPSFDAYVTQLLGLALVGSEIEQQLAFISESRDGLDSKSKNALLWIDYLKKFNK